MSKWITSNTRKRAEHGAARHQIRAADAYKYATSSRDAGDRHHAILMQLDAARHAAEAMFRVNCLIGVGAMKLNLTEK